ncbi:MAG: hypothetical protein ACKPGI_19515 [Verrucomicrobiota bacterium]
MRQILVISDIHYASDGEAARCGYEARAIGNPVLREASRTFRHWIWLREPHGHNHRLQRLIEANPFPDRVVANGDFSLDSGFIGVSDPEAYESARLALDQLRVAYGSRLRTTLGDHELGKKSLFGGAGGVRLASWERAVDGLGIPGFWSEQMGRFVLVGVASTPIALPVFLPEMLPSETEAWRRIAEGLRAQVRETFGGLEPGQRVVLFVHDPSALPFLSELPEVRARMDQIVCTVVGHLHTPAVFRLGSRLAGMPIIPFLGNTVRRYSIALRRAGVWKKFRTVLCPSPSGIQLLKDGGWLELRLSDTGEVEVVPKKLPWDV